jgi:endonuclease/exonuclease/phosphatase family metal-dependent hydrolase
VISLAGGRFVEIKVMSFNLRYDNEGDGVNSFTNRFERVLETIRNESADVIGFQEVTDSMRKRVRDALGEYTVIGCGRDKNCHGEAMLIAYKKDDFELLSVENVWLSDTPDVPGSRYEGIDQSGCPRMYSRLLLKKEGVAEPFYFINTHLDHEGAKARYFGAEQITNDILAKDRKFVLTGDFNAVPSDPEIELIVSKIAKRGGVDCTEGFPPTFHAFWQWPPEKHVKIDYIFSDAVCKNAYVVEDIPVNGQYYSDHNAVCAVLDI